MLLLQVLLLRARRTPLTRAQNGSLGCRDISDFSGEMVSSTWYWSFEFRTGQSKSEVVKSILPWSMQVWTGPFNFAIVSSILNWSNQFWNCHLNSVFATWILEWPLEFCTCSFDVTLVTSLISPLTQFCSGQCTWVWSIHAVKYSPVGGSPKIRFALRGPSDHVCSPSWPAIFARRWFP